jgi:hypothetical protein
MLHSPALLEEVALPGEPSSFQANILAYLSQHQEYKLAGVRFFLIKLSDDSLLHVYEESVNEESAICDHCRIIGERRQGHGRVDGWACRIGVALQANELLANSLICAATTVGWGHHPVSAKKYHFIVPAEVRVGPPGAHSLQGGETPPPTRPRIPAMPVNKQKRRSQHTRADTLVCACLHSNLHINAHFRTRTAAHGCPHSCLALCSLARNLFRTPPHSWPEQKPCTMASHRMPPLPPHWHSHQRRMPQAHPGQPPPPSSTQRGIDCTVRASPPRPPPCMHATLPYPTLP